MLGVVVQIDGWDPVARAPVSLRAASHDDSAMCHLGGGAVWWPALIKLPTLRYDLFDGAFGGEITAPSSSLTLAAEPWPDFGSYALADAKLQLWTGEVGQPWSAWTLRFVGRISEQPQLENGSAVISFAVDDRWLDGALLTTYAGTTGAEGSADLKGQPKPLALGAPRYVAGTLIDSVNSVFQISAYGSMRGFQAALEKLARYGAPLADYADYSALVAANVPAGQWATARATGMARLGAPPAGQITFLVSGDDAGPDGWARRPGQIIRRLALLSGGAGRINDASLNALDTARPYNLSVDVDQQTTARQLIQQIAASVNAVAGMSWTGELFVVPVGIAAPSLTLAADGSALPAVSAVKQVGIASPFKKLAIGAERAWTVHELADIAFTAPLVDVGAYNAATIYREGNIASLPDGSRWLYVNATPAAGHTPSTAAADYWSNLNPATAYADGTLLEDLKPAQAGADVTGDNTAADTNAVAGRPASEVTDGLDKARTDITNLVATFGSTEAAAVSADAARDAAAVANAARDQSAAARDLAQAAQVAAGDYAGASAQSRTLSDQARGLAEQAKTDAVAARDAAASAQSLAASSKTGADAAKAAAEQARDLASTARSASESAQTAAQAARDLALGYQNDAKSAASAAAGSATTATTKATDAGNSATSATASATTASTKAKDASDSAAASASSASGAASSSTTAGQSASAAQTNATTAATKAGEASTSANSSAASASDALGSKNAAQISASAAATSAQGAGNSATAASTSAGSAATKATDAGNSATAANTSAVNAASSYGTARTQIASLFPERVYDGTTSFYMTGAGNTALYGGAPATKTSNIALTAFVSKAGFGYVWQPPADGTNILPLGALPIVAGNTYEVSAEWEVVSLGTANVSIRQWVAGLDASYGYLTISAVTTTARAATGIFTSTARYATAAAAGVLAAPAGAGFLRPCIQLAVGPGSGSVVQLRRVIVRDITAQLTAEAQATAAATSASSAATSATNAGQSATAASTSATNASTSAGNAQTYANNASTSATGAAGSANTASTQAGVASQAKADADSAKGAAQTAATAAAGSASTAATKATDAGNSATSATASANTASSKAKDASDSATAASLAASAADASSTAAGQQASAAQSSATSAATKAGEASTSASNSASSASDALGSRNSAATSASAAAQSRTDAGNSATAASTSAGTASTQASNAGNSAIAANTSATNAASSYNAAAQAALKNIIAKNVFDDGSLGGWTSSSVVADAGPANLGRTKVQQLGAGNDATEGDLRPGNWASRYYRARGWIKTPANSTPGAGVQVSKSDGALQYVYTTAIATTANVWTYFDVIVGPTPGSSVSGRPFLRHENGTATMFTDVTIEDITDSTQAAASATAAASSASQASTSASDAGQKASAADTARTAAETAKGLAESYRNNAAQSATDASSARSAAQTAQGIAVSARDAATTTAQNLHPTTFEQGVSFFGGDEGSTTPSAVLETLNGVQVFLNPAADASGALSWKTCIANTGGKFRVRAKVGNYQGVASSVQLRLEGYTVQAPASLSNRVGIQVADRPTPADGFVWVEAIFDAPSIATTPFLRPEIIINYGAGAGNTFVRCQALELGDVTSELNAASAATAASGSASSASASATAAGQSAGAADSSKQAAATLAGQADASRSSAATSASSADGYRNAAATSASVAATARDQANAAKTDAQSAASASSGSASTAAASSSTAGQSASAADSARANAVTAKGQAETARDAAVSAKNDAAGSANTAAAQATLATSAQAASQGYANAASTSAASASSSSTSAGQSAETARTYRDQASAANGTAQTAAGNAQGYASQADASRAAASSAASVSASYSLGALNQNSNFNAPGWGDGNPSTPVSWSIWDRGSQYLGKWNGTGMFGPFALRLDRANGQQNGVQQALSNIGSGLFYLECTVGCEDGDLTGCGAYIDFGNGYSYKLDFATMPDTDGSVTATPGRARSWSIPVRNGAGADRVLIYAMAGWEGFTGNRTWGSVRTIWHKLVLRPASGGEIDGRQAKADSATNNARIEQVSSALASDIGALSQRAQNVEARAGGLESRTAIVETAAASANTRLAAARLELSAVSSGGRASMAIRSDSNNGAGVDIIGDVAFLGSGSDGGKTVITPQGGTVYYPSGKIAYRWGIWQA